MRVSPGKYLKKVFVSGHLEGDPEVVDEVFVRQYLEGAPFFEELVGKETHYRRNDGAIVVKQPQPARPVRTTIFTKVKK